MNDHDLVKVLAKIQLGDNRQVDHGTVAFWRETIGDLDVQDALDAVAQHFRESTDYLQPAHLRRIVKERRATPPEVFS